MQYIIVSTHQLPLLLFLYDAASPSFDANHVFTHGIGVTMASQRSVHSVEQKEKPCVCTDWMIFFMQYIRFLIIHILLVKIIKPVTLLTLLFKDIIIVLVITFCGCFQLTLGTMGFLFSGVPNKRCLEHVRSSDLTPLTPRHENEVSYQRKFLGLDVKRTSSVCVCTHANAYIAWTNIHKYIHTRKHTTHSWSHV